MREVQIFDLPASSMRSTVSRRNASAISIVWRKRTGVLPPIACAKAALSPLPMNLPKARQLREVDEALAAAAVEGAEAPAGALFYQGAILDPAQHLHSCLAQKIISH
ncbi:hypothetical protein AB7M37_006680 [Sinorhizobium fredii]